MKKFVSAVFAAVIFISGSSFSGNVVYGVEKDIKSETIKVKLNGEVLSFDTAPVLIGGRVMVPMRAIFESLNAVVAWEEETNTAIAYKGDTVLSVQIGNKKLFKGGAGIELDVAPMLWGDKTMVPVRAVTEAFDCKVEWAEKTKEVLITTKQEKSVVVDEAKKAE